MRDYGHEFADAQVDEWRAEVAETFRQAQEDAQEALSSFLARFDEQDAEKRANVAAGDLPRADYDAWRRGKMLAGKRYADMLDQVAAAYASANEAASAALAGKLPDVYAENANFAAYQVCQGAGADVSFSLVDAWAVQEALTKGEALLPVPSPNRAKDTAWNRKLVASQLSQGIMLGESIPKMAKRVENVTGSNVATAVRAARTYATAAENAGRVSSYERAKAMGIDLKQEWVATLDNRTRHSHRQIDGEQVEVGEKFSNGCRYPGDPDAPYAETMNCRCTLVAAVAGFDTSDAKRWSRLPAGTTYEQWKGARASDGNAVREGASGIAEAVRSYIDESRKMGLTAPGFRPRPRKAVELPKDEYASVMSELNGIYHARLAGKEHAIIPIGSYNYEIDISGYNEYRIVGKREI